MHHHDSDHHCVDVGVYPRHCNDFENLAHPGKSGVTLIQPNEKEEPFRVFCDMNDHGGGWIRVQHAYKHHFSFNRSLASYEEGFGLLDGDGWLGLNKIHQLTSGKYKAVLLVKITDYNGREYYAQYDTFIVEGAEKGYRLTVANYSGDAGDALSYSSNATFSTYDVDTDKSSQSCASFYKAGWWYKDCFRGKLNGDSLNQVYHVSYTQSRSRYRTRINTGIFLKWNGNLLQQAEMKIRLA